MIESAKNCEKFKIKFKKSTDMKISVSNKRRRPLDVHNEIKNEDCIFCDDVTHEKKLRDAVRGNVPVGYLCKSDIGKEQPQHVALTSDGERSPNNVLCQEREVKGSLKGFKSIATPLDTNANCGQVLNANNETDKIHNTTEKKNKNRKHQKKLKQKMGLKQLRKNSHSHVKFPKKFGKRFGSNEPLRATTVEENLPCGWKKCAVQRKGGSSVGKWDVFYISPQGRKFRSRNELASYLKEVDGMFHKTKFNFSFHQHKRTEKPVAKDHQTQEAISSVRNDSQNTKLGYEPQKRIKTLLPKIRSQEEENETPLPCSSKSKQLCESNIGNEGCFSTRLEIQPQVECHKSLSSSSMLQTGPENFHSAASSVPLSKIDSESGENWMTFGATADEPYQHADEPDMICVKEEDIASPSPEYDNMNLEDTHTEEFIGQEPIRCLCGMKDEDGLMIQCDVCQCWQHALCNDIVYQDDVPQHFICYFCRHPDTEQQSVKHFDDQDWLYKGQLPSLSFVKEDTERVAKCEATLATVHHLLADLCYVKDYLHCLRVKTTVVKSPNHPKLILWNKYEMNEERQDTDVIVDVTSTPNGIKDYPQPEAAIDFNICQKKLLQHLHESHQKVEKKLNDIEEKFQDLENDFTSSGYGSSEMNTQDAIKSMLKDLEKICLMCKYL